MWIQNRRKINAHIHPPTHTLPFSWQWIQIAKIKWDDAGLLGCVTALLDKWFPTLLQHSRNRLSSHTVAHPIRPETQLECCKHLKTFRDQRR
jgi:hypothetical protein